MCPADPTSAQAPHRTRARNRPANHTLRALLEETEWTQAAFAHAITRVGAEVGIHLRYDRTSVAHWLRGSRPDPRVQRLIAEALSRRLGRPVTVAELGMRSARTAAGQRDRRGQRPHRAPRGAPSDDEGAEGGDPSGPAAPVHPADRLTALTAPVVPAPRADAPPPAPYRLRLLSEPAQQPRPARSPLPSRAGRGRGQPAATGVPGARPPGEGEVASVHEHARFFALQADRHGGGHIRTSLAAYLSGLVRTLRSGGDSAHHRGMLAGAARLSFLLARVYADEGRHGLAQRAFLTAAELAAEGDDPEGVALARRALSSQAHQLGHPRESLALAEAACGAAPAGADPSARAFLYAGLAVARAGLGDRERAMDALRSAEHQLARAPADLTTGPRSPGGEPVGSYQDAALLYQSSQVRAALGDRSGAIGDLRSSLRSRPAAERRSRALCQAELAELLLSCGRLEEACGSWKGFLEDCALVRSGRVREARARMPALLRPYARERCVQSLLAHTNPLASGARFD
ncbi:Tat pathway signal protein [Streptomyces albiaxialis]|uniref:Tat pathway signal protein n=1 Tax=Streptomyces albiaxialis TaxID=329523 RepID=A0ABP5HG38_9ACTN